MLELLLCLITAMKPAQDLSHIQPYSSYIGVEYALNSEDWQLWNRGKVLSSFELVEHPYDGFPAEWLVGKLRSGTRIRVESIKRQEYRLCSLLFVAVQDRAGWDYYAVVSLDHPNHPKRRIRATIPFHFLANCPENNTDVLDSGTTSLPAK